jgi:spermidine/putrescine transport system permease protein
MVLRGDGLVDRALNAVLPFPVSVDLMHSYPAVVIGLVHSYLPYMVLTCYLSLQAIDQSLIEAARSLGASPWQVAWRVTLPWIAPGVVAGALFAFAVSFDQFVVSYFLATPGETTLPVKIYAAIRKGFTPEINPVSTIIIAISMGAMLMAARFFKFGGER